MSSLQTQASLIVAGFQLFAVQQVIKAIDNADKASASSPGVGTIVRDPIYAPRRIIRREAEIEACKSLCRRPHEVVVRPTYNYQCRPCVVRPADVIPEVVIVPVDRSPNELPMQPPWKVLPWQYPLQPAPPVKVVRVQPDMLNKGTLLDCFV